MVLQRTFQAALQYYEITRDSVAQLVLNIVEAGPPAVSNLAEMSLQQPLVLNVGTTKAQQVRPHTSAERLACSEAGAASVVSQVSARTFSTA